MALLSGKSVHSLPSLDSSFFQIKNPFSIFCKTTPEETHCQIDFDSSVLRGDVSPHFLRPDLHFKWSGIFTLENPREKPESERIERITRNLEIFLPSFVILCGGTGMVYTIFAADLAPFHSLFKLGLIGAAGGAFFGFTTTLFLAKLEGSIPIHFDFSFSKE